MPPPSFLPSLSWLESLCHHVPGSTATVPPPVKLAGPSRQKFTADEDSRLRAIVAEVGESDWAAVSRRMGTRSARQCRERFRNCLADSVKNQPWTDAEDKLLTDQVSLHGSKWSLIVSSFPSRSEVNIKNRWTLLSNRTMREADIEEEKRQLTQVRAAVGAAGKKQPEFDFGEWEGDDFMDMF
jgi:hypothetical protein